MTAEGQSRHRPPFPWCAGVRVAPLAGERILDDGGCELVTGDGAIHRLNASARALWRLCRSGCSPADMVAQARAIAGGYGGAVAEDVRQGIEAFVAAGLVMVDDVPVPVASHPPVPTTIICLRRDTARRRHVTGQLVPGLAGSPTAIFAPRVYDAVDGQDAGQVAAALDRLGVRVEPAFARIATPGQLGNWLSHLGVLQDLLDSGQTHGVVLEDDAGIRGIDPGCRLLAVLEDLRGLEWDLVYLYVFDHHHATQRRNPALAVAGRPSLMKPYYAWCTLAYLVSARGAEKMRDLSRTVVDTFDEYLQVLIAAGRLDAYYAREQLFANLGQKTRNEPPREGEFASNVFRDTD